MSSKVSLWVFSYPNLVYNNLNTPKMFLSYPNKEIIFNQLNIFLC